MVHDTVTEVPGPERISLAASVRRRIASPVARYRFWPAGVR